mgnify:FL=1
MSIQYRFVPIYDNLNEDGEKVTGFYPKVVSRGTVNKERMFEEISRGSSSLRSELARSWMLMEDYIIDRLKDGYDVCLNDFCTFGVSAKYRRVDRINEIRAESIFVKGMHVRTSEVVNKKLRWARFEREPEATSGFINRYFYRPVSFSSVFISRGPFLVALPVKLETSTYRAW